MARKTGKSLKSKSESPASAEKSTVSRTAAGVIPAARSANLMQLRRARGQIDGIERMVADDRYCVDIITQIMAARASLQVVAKALLEAHLKYCHEVALRNGGAEADRMYQEVVDLVSKMAR